MCTGASATSLSPGEAAAAEAAAAEAAGLQHSVMRRWIKVCASASATSLTAAEHWLLPDARAAPLLLLMLLRHQLQWDGTTELIWVDTGRRQHSTTWTVPNRQMVQPRLLLRSHGCALVGGYGCLRSSCIGVLEQRHCSQSSAFLRLF
jgi:hypothetical protein